MENEVLRSKTKKRRRYQNHMKQTINDKVSNKNVNEVRKKLINDKIIQMKIK